MEGRDVLLNGKIDFPLPVDLILMDNGFQFFELAFVVDGVRIKFLIDLVNDGRRNVLNDSGTNRGKFFVGPSPANGHGAANFLVSPKPMALVDDP